MHDEGELDHWLHTLAEVTAHVDAIILNKRSKTLMKNVFLP